MGKDDRVDFSALEIDDKVLKQNLKVLKLYRENEVESCLSALGLKIHELEETI